MKHELKRERAGKAEMGSITPTCSCGWRGRTEYAYNDYCHTNVREQEGDHIRKANRGELETANAPHEGPGAASSRTVPLDAVVGRHPTEDTK